MSGSTESLLSSSVTIPSTTLQYMVGVGKEGNNQRTNAKKGN
jgi:hypothetical protein